MTGGGTSLEAASRKLVKMYRKCPVDWSKTTVAVAASSVALVKAGSGNATVDAFDETPTDCGNYDSDDCVSEYNNAVNNGARRPRSGARRARVRGTGARASSK